MKNLITTLKAIPELTDKQQELLSTLNEEYKRAGIYEILTVNEEIRAMILKKASSDAIERKAREQGVKSLMHSGWEKVFAGVTTPEEVRRVTQIEE